MPLATKKKSKLSHHPMIRLSDDQEFALYSYNPAISSLAGFLEDYALFGEIVKLLSDESLSQERIQRICNIVIIIKNQFSPCSIAALLATTCRVPRSHLLLSRIKSLFLAHGIVCPACLTNIVCDAPLMSEILSERVRRGKTL